MRRDGMMVIDKGRGLSSFDVIRRLRRLTGERKLGHAGTLDPMATGVLLVMFNKATRLSQYLMGAHKAYLATVTLGVRTETDDVEGDVIEERSLEAITEAAVREALMSFVGEIEQVPPQHSAIRVGGKRAYAVARAGEHVELKARKVVIDAIEDVEVELPEVRFEVRCGKGTYIRSMARDLGEVLACGGHLTGLRRTECGGFSVEEAVTLEQVEAAGEAWPSLLHSPLETMRAYPRVELGVEEAQLLSNGAKLSRMGELEPGVYGVPAPGTEELLAVVERDVKSGPRLRVFLPGWRKEG